MSHIEAISNGLGAQSMYMLVMAGEGRLPARLSISADTGWENDRLRNDGVRTSNAEYFDQVVMPYAEAHDIEAVFVRSVNKEGVANQPLGDWMRAIIEAGDLNQLKIPLFGSNGGRLGQSCTGRTKITAIRQELRRRGATTARTAHGLHRGEVGRMKGHSGRVEGGYYTLTSIDVNWHSHYYPLIEAGLFRVDIRRELEQRSIPYLLSSECDGCPHQDWPRWSRHTPEVIDYLAGLEALCNGEFFFTDRRIPLKEALEQMRQEAEAKAAAQPINMFDDDIDFGCDEGGVCGI